MVARSFNGPFSTAEFHSRYREMYPSRNEGSFLVSDYAYNNKQVAKDEFPSFLEMLDRAKYQFIGLDEGQRKKARNPDWTRDEIMLALEFYLDHRNKIPGKGSAEIATLSEEIKRVAIALGLSGDEKFRNVNGVYMKIMNIRSHDPAYTSQGKVGLASASKLEEEVWSRFGEDLPALKTLNASIRAQCAGSQVDPLYAEYDEPEVAEATEGRIVTRLHRGRERSRKLVERKKNLFLKANGSLRCEACDFDFSQFYGSRGEGYIECHHTKPLHEMKPNEKTKLSDLALLCANCHRVIHAKRPWLTLGSCVI